MYNARFQISILSILLFLGIGVNISLAQSKEDCRCTLQNYLETMKDQIRTRDDKAYYMEMDSKKIFYSGRTESNHKVFIKAPEFNSYEDNNAAYFMDHRDLIMVVKPEKMIYERKAVKNPLDEDNIDRSVAFQESLFSNSDIQSCEKKGDALEVVLVPESALIEKYKIVQVKIVIDQKKNSLVSEETTYKRGQKNGLRKQLNTYEKVSYDYKGSISESARSEVFDRGGKLRKRYQGYQVIKEK